MLTKLLQRLAVSVAFGTVGCGGSDDQSAPTPGSDAGGANGANQTGGGGSVQIAGSGGGGIASAGGNHAAGGALASAGGANAAGSGGSGNPATGGAASGGQASTGGARTGSGGGGAVGTGGAATGGAATGSGGNDATGGTAGTGGTSSGCNMGTTHTGGNQYCSNTVGNVGNGYSYLLWSNGQGTGCMNVFGSDATFKADWSNVGDFLARVGLGWDSTKTYDQLGTISSDFAFTKSISGGLSYIGIYGWSVNPLIEYYIIEDWEGGRPTFVGTQVSTISVPGEGTYDVYKHTQVNQPSISGSNATFDQFFSLRQEARQCGHITISEHFKKWADLGLQLGKMEEARILVETMNNSGSIEFTTATVVAN